MGLTFRIKDYAHFSGFFDCRRMWTFWKKKKNCQFWRKCWLWGKLEHYFKENLPSEIPLCHWTCSLGGILHVVIAFRSWTISLAIKSSVGCRMHSREHLLWYIMVFMWPFLPLFTPSIRHNEQVFWGLVWPNHQVQNPHAHSVHSHVLCVDHENHYGMEYAGYRPLCLLRCLWGIWVSSGAQWPVPRTFHKYGMTRARNWYWDDAPGALVWSSSDSCLGFENWLVTQYESSGDESVWGMKGHQRQCMW